ncbi:MAG TPA: hypothetical protein DCP69_09985 [Candidatus Omnitrophica bacterium]|nr:hypothetical protein [Candidatus Omnitrophota bacterium]
MAVSARFSADFSDFYSAVQKAEVSLRSFETGAGKVESSLTRMANSLSGTKTIQQATLMAEAVARVGGASTLTAREQARVNATVTEAIAKYQALGQQAPKALTDLAAATKGAGKESSVLGDLVSFIGPKILAAFSIGSLLAFTRELIRMGDETTRAAAQLGITTTEVQQLGFIATQSGNSLTQITDAVSMLMDRLASGDKSAVGAVRALRLNLNELLAANPYEMFTLIADAISKIPSSLEQTRIARDLFGRSGAQLLPTFKADIDALAVATPLMAEETVKALDDAGDSWEAFYLRAKVAAANVLALTAGAFKEQNHELDNLGAVYRKFIPTVASAGGIFDTASGQAKALTMSESELKRVTEELTKPVIENIAAFEKLRQQIAGPNLTGEIALLDDVWSSLLATSTPTVAMFDRATEAALKFQAAGGTLTAQLADLVRMQQLVRSATAGLSDDFASVGQQVGLNLDPLKALTEEAAFFAEQAAFDAETAKLMAAGAGEMASANTTAAASATEAGKAFEGMALVGTISYDHLAQGATGAASVVVRSFAEMRRAYIETSVALLEQAKATAEFNDWLAQHTGMSGRIGGLPAPPPMPTTYIPGFTSGVENFRGGPAIVGERGPELVNLPRGASVTPNSALGGVSVSVDARGSFFDTPTGQARFARMVSDAIDKKLRSGGIAVGRA